MKFIIDGLVVRSNSLEQAQAKITFCKKYFHKAILSRYRVSHPKALLAVMQILVNKIDDRCKPLDDSFFYRQCWVLTKYREVPVVRSTDNPSHILITENSWRGYFEPFNAKIVKSTHLKTMSYPRNSVSYYATAFEMANDDELLVAELNNHLYFFKVPPAHTE